MNISELLSNPSMLHAAIVHMPIAAGVIGLVFVILSAIFHRNNTVRALTALIFLIVAASAYVAIETGENARELVPNTLSNDVWTPLDAHAESAERVLYAGIFTLACLVISLIRFDAIRIGALLLAAVGAIATNIFCANTGHLGGILVYNHGVGTPFIHQTPQGGAPVEPVQPPAVETPAGVPVPVPVAAPEPELIPIKDFTPEEAAQVSFQRDVWPIINEHCIDCHENPDADGEYDMSTVENMLKAGKKAGPGIVPGKPDESSVIQYIRGLSKPQMPKKEEPLSPETVHTLRMWIAAGAKDDSSDAASTPEAPVATEAASTSATEPAPTVESTPEPAAAPVVEAPAAAETATPAAETPPVVEAAPALEAPSDVPVVVTPEAPAAESTPPAVEPAPAETTPAQVVETAPVESPAAG